MRIGTLSYSLAGLLLAMASFMALAGSPGAVREQAEASMVVTGTIDIAPDGGVAGYVLDKPEALPDSVPALAAKVLPRWRFKPVLVDGKPVRARAKMSLRYVAKRQQDDKYRVSILGASFGAGDDKPGEQVAAGTMTPPDYPSSAQRAGITGTAYVVLRVGRDGKVAEAVVERVNLTVAGSERVMERGRKLLGDASLAALRRWTFSVPESGPAAAKPSWDVRVPVTFRLGGPKSAAYGEWEAYIPGPYQAVPWLPPGKDHGSDALVAGGIYPIDSGPELLTPLGANAG